MLWSGGINQIYHTYYTQPENMHPVYIVLIVGVYPTHVEIRYKCTWYDM